MTPKKKLKININFGKKLVQLWTKFGPRPSNPLPPVECCSTFNPATFSGRPNVCEMVTDN